MTRAADNSTEPIETLDTGGDEIEMPPETMKWLNLKAGSVYGYESTYQGRSVPVAVKVKAGKSRAQVGRD